MKSMHTEKGWFKTLNVMVIYALGLQVLIPGVTAYGQIIRKTGSYRFGGSVTAGLPSFPITSSEPAANLAAETVQTTNTPEISMPAPAPMISAGGPGQTESSGFSLGSMDGMVDQFTGDFSYSIPLMDVEGYPITISYNSNVGMTDEASWVGLGWNLNVGSVSRDMRGIPDEFDGTQSVSRTYNLKEDNTTNGQKYGVIGGVSYRTPGTGQIIRTGADLSLLWGSYKNDYLGLGKTFDFGFSARYSIGTNDLSFGPKVGLGYTRDSKSGIGRSSSVGLQAGYMKDGSSSPSGTLGLSWGSGFNSRYGVSQRSINLGVSMGYMTNNGGVVGGTSFGSTFTCGSLTAIPRLELGSHYKNVHGMVDATVGFQLTKFAGTSVSIGAEVQFYHSTQTFDFSDPVSQVINTAAFGYLHSEKRSHYTGDNAVMDFNRERGQEFSESMKTLPFAFPTYDVFYANASGMGATFRGQRSDVGVYHDDLKSAFQDGTSSEIDAGFVFFSSGFGVQLGYSQGNINAETKTGHWETGSTSEVFQFGSDSTVYFKGIGEPTPHSTGLLDSTFGLEPAYLSIDKSADKESMIKTPYLFSASGDVALVSSAALNSANGDEIIANIYTPKTAAELAAETYTSYEINTFVDADTIALHRISGNRKANHISAVDITTTSGMHYTYGIPTYTVAQSEVVFSNDHYSVNSNGLASYNPGVDNSIANAKGRANLFDKTTLPSYAHAFLLTEVTSSDYVDRTDNGPSLDDMGSYYNIKYTELFDAEHTFRSRFPMAEDTAMIDQGLLGTTLDDVSSYSYTEKEIWYTHSVESKNYVAEFVLEDRIDAYGVDNENGTPDFDLPLKRLARIVLYNLSDRLTNGVNALPLQTVEFEYDYSLCKKNPANSNTYGGTSSASGKLTLKAIRVYSGAISQETALAPYLFDYSETNPDFNYRNIDRWGNYKVNDTDKPNNLFPYAEQDPTTANANSQAWKLVQISSPMGAELEITYAADSYAFVQNKRAMEHLEIAGYTSAYELAYLSELATFDGTERLSNQLQKELSLISDIADMADDISPGWSSGLAGVIIGITDAVNTNSVSMISNDLPLMLQLKYTPANVVVFQLNQPISAATRAAASDTFRKQYLNTTPLSTDTPHYLKEVYLKNRVKVESGIENYEVIPTVANIDPGTVDFSAFFPFDAVPSTGVLPPNAMGAYEYGYIVLDNVVSTDDGENILMNPVQRTALEFVRLHLPDKVYGACDGCTPDLSVDRKVFWGGDLYRILSKHYCQTVNLELSSVRCFDHDNYKFGGNVKVTKLVFRDHWNAISGEYDSDYGWNYTTSDDVRKKTNVVAAYEPRVGADENPFYNWNRYTNKSVSFPDETQFSIEPNGESLFPSPIVGYSSSELNLSGNRVTPNNTLGKSVSRFLTAFDKPTLHRSTDLQKAHAKKNNILYKEVDLFGFSQGHIVVTNDFHGKPLEYEVFDRQGHSQTLTHYFYKGLLDTVPMLDRDGEIHSEAMALEYDIYADSRFSRTDGTVATFGGGILVPIFPFGLPYLYPSIGFSKRISGFYSHTLNKHVNYSAVVDRIETISLGSGNTAKNMVYDRYSGATLLSSLKDEFNDTLYALSYPSHWYHEDLQSPLLQPNNTVTGVITTGLFTFSSYLGDLFSAGDKVSIVVGSSPAVTGNILDVLGSTMHLIDHASGKHIHSSTAQACKVTLISSNRKNRLMETMQSVTTKRNPLSANQTAITFPDKDVIDASAISYTRRYHVLCTGEDERLPPNSVGVGDTINPFSYGVMNDLLMEHQYMVQVERSSTQTQGIRFDGTLANNGSGSFILFYEYNTSSDRWFRVNQTGHPHFSSADSLRKWRPSGEVATYDEYGKPLDAFSQIQVFSAVQYGYNRLNKLVPVAQAVNAQQNEIGFDSFEDYDYHFPDGITYGGDIGHFDFTDAYLNSGGDLVLSTREKHSGLRSMEVTSGSARMSRPITDPEGCNKVLDGLNGAKEFIVDSCNCVKPFAPSPGIYIVGAWVKGADLNDSAEYTDMSVDVSFIGSATTYELRPTGQLLDGWQRVEGEIEIPSDATVIRIDLKNRSESHDPVYFDDVRVHPFLAGMTTTVYDPDNLLPLATHDGYNFTTFYNYDENLNQVSVRVETIDGIKTVSGVEASTLKTYK